MGMAYLCVRCSAEKPHVGQWIQARSAGTGKWRGCVNPAGNVHQHKGVAVNVDVLGPSLHFLQTGPRHFERAFHFDNLQTRIKARL